MYIWILVAYLLIYVWMTVRGPSIWDRLLGMQLVSTKVVAIVIVYASITDTTFFLDVAIIYALFGFTATIFITLFIMETRRQDIKPAVITDEVSAELSHEEGAKEGGS